MNNANVIQELIIDICASGGRINLEIVSRGVFLWWIDYQYFEPNGYQFHHDDIHGGIILIFHRHKCLISKIKLNLRALSPSTIYEVCFEDLSIKRKMTGRGLLKRDKNGNKNALESLLITYREVQSSINSD